MFNKSHRVNSLCSFKITMQKEMIVYASLILTLKTKKENRHWFKNVTAEAANFLNWWPIDIKPDDF